MRVHLIVAILISGSLNAQSPIEEFDKVMDAYNEEFTSAKNEAEEKAVNLKYEDLINKAEITFESDLEAQIKADDEALKAEQEASAKELVALEKESDDIEVDSIVPDIVKEWELYTSRSTNIKYLSSQFLEKELIEIGKYYGFEWTTKGTKLAKIKELLK